MSDHVALLTDGAILRRLKTATRRLQDLVRLMASDNHRMLSPAMLSRRRDELAAAILETPPEDLHVLMKEPAGAFLEEFIREHARHLRLRLTPDEDWIARIALSPDDAPLEFQRKLTAGLLVAPVYDLTPGIAALPPETISALPGVLLNQLAPEPSQIRSDQHRDRYTAYLRDLATALTRLIDAKGRSGALTAHMVLAGMNLNPLFSIPDSGRAVREAIGAVIDQCAAWRAAPFTGAGGGNRRRIALYWRDVVDRTENYAGCAVLEDLAGKFEVHSFIHAAGHTLQAGQGGAVARLVREKSASVTPLANMAGSERVAAIREADCGLAMPVSNIVYGVNPYIYDFAARVAPRQAAFYTSPLTTGMAAMDYWITGRDSEGEGAEDHFSEQVVFLEGSIIKFRGVTPPVARDTAPAAWRRRLGDAPVFAAGGSVYKFSPEQVRLWGRLLRARPDVRLLLYPFNPNWGSFYSLDVMTSAMRRIDPDFPVDRLIVLGPRASFTEVADVVAACDVYLDTWPHSGGFSTSDGLLAGLPVVTLEGPWQRARQGADVLRQMGLDGFIAADEDQMIDLSLSLAEDPVRYAEAQAEVQAALGRSRLFEGYNGALCEAVETIIEKDPA
ncbi:hypothetical protein [Euryhalocaulis caribicus]|uniref:O-linked N-acetylglucosamine transferase family protein n=1 Tax=Euryhalocaulis caribicus TaxID=1161401 RepID=UPI00039CB101|nr:hypothetical protein [Euryhalocaulis caribicus]